MQKRVEPKYHRSRAKQIPMKKFTKFAIAMLLAATANTPTQAQWAQEPNEAHPFFPVFFAASYGGKLYAVGNGGIASSADNGASWTNLTAIYSWAGGGGNSNREAVFSGSMIYVRTTTQGVIRSLDAGATWDVDTVGIGSGKQVDMIYFDGTTVFCTTNWPEYGFYKKTPASASWTKVTGMSPVLGMTKKGTKLYAFTAADMHTSTDGGTTWVNTATVATSTTYSGSPVHVIGSDLYSNGKRSTDDGLTWTNLAYSGSAYYTDGTNYYIGFGPMGGNDSVAMTSDGGATWTVSGGGGLNALVTSIVKHNGALYASVWSRGQLIKNGTNSSSGTAITERNSSVMIAPNPSSGVFRVMVPGLTDGEIAISDAQGRVVARLHTATPEFTVDMANQSPGVYYLQVVDQNRVLRSLPITLSK